MAYDSARKRVILVGGWDGKAKGDVWEFDGRTWRMLQANAMPGRVYPCLAGGSGMPVTLYGGADRIGFSAVAMADTWVLGTAGFQQVFPQTQVPAKWGAAMAEDTSRGRIVLFGSGDAWSGGDFRVLEWDGVDWAVKYPQSVVPVIAWGTAVTSPWTGRMLMLTDGSASGGSAMWEWSGVAWNLASSPDPKGVVSAPVVLDANGKGVIELYPPDGMIQRFDGTKWTWVAQHGSLANVSAQIAWDATRDEILVVDGGHPSSGSSGVFQTWSVRDGRYSLANAAVSPPIREAFGLVHDPDSGVTVLHGGARTGGYFDDTWMWNGMTWAPGPGTVKPPISPWVKLCYDARYKRTRMFAFGGMAWEWSLQTGWSRSSSAFDLPSYASIPAGMAADMRSGEMLALVYRSTSTGGRIETWRHKAGAWAQIAHGSTFLPMIVAGLWRSRLLDRWLCVHSGHQLAAPTVFVLEGDEWREIEAARFMVGAPPLNVEFGAGCWDATHDRYLMWRPAALVPSSAANLWQVSVPTSGMPQPRPRLGESVTLHLDFAARTGTALALFSDRSWPGTPLRWVPGHGFEVLPLAATQVLAASASLGLSAPIDSFGHASVSLGIPSQAGLAGLELFWAGLSVTPAGLGSATSNLRMEILPK